MVIEMPSGVGTGASRTGGSSSVSQDEPAPSVCGFPSRATRPSVTVTPSPATLVSVVAVMAVARHPRPHGT